MILKKLNKTLLLIATVVFCGFGLPKNVEKRVSKEVEKHFKKEELSFHTITVSSEVNSKLPVTIGDGNLFKITDGVNFVGYGFVDKAASKTAQFDYLVLFNENLEVVHSKVLIYREEYGGEIGSKRWLKQFLGKSGGDRVSFENDIDGIAGATISVRSMVNAMDNLLQTIGILQENKVL